MTAPVGIPGADTWRPAEGDGPPASPRTQAVAAVVAAAPLVLLAIAEPQVRGWVVADLLALGGGIAIGNVAPPTVLLRRLSGLVLSALVLGLGLVAIMLLWAAADVEVPPGIVPLLALAVLGLDWRRADRLGAVVLVAGAFVLLLALSEEGWAIAGAIAWLAGAFAAFSLIEADRRAALPRVQPEADEGALGARPDELLTTIAIAAGIALLAALVLSVPSCQRRLSQPSTPSLPDATGLPDGGGSGGGSAGGGGSGGGSGGAGQPGGGVGGVYVPSEDGRYLVPRDPGATSPGTDRVPSPDDVPTGLEPGVPRTTPLPDGSERTYERDGQGRTEVTVREPDGSITRWRFEPRGDGLVQIDRLDPDGRSVERWWYDPDGQIASGGGSAPEVDGPDASRTDQQDPDAPDPARRRPELGGALAVLGVLLVVALLGWLAARWWRGRRPPEGEAVADAPPWALALAARIDEEGAARGRPRAPDETIVRYGRALAAGPLPDPRLEVVGEVVSDALFGGADPGPVTASWATGTFDDVVAQHPRPSRRERRAGEPAPPEPVGG